MGEVKDFWQEPTYAELLQAMQKRVHDYVVADKGTAKEALDLLIKDWTEGLQGRRQDLMRPRGLLRGRPGSRPSRGSRSPCIRTFAR